MKIERRFTVAADRPLVWRLIRDPERMIACVPGCETIEAIDADTYKAAVVVTVGPIKPRFNLIVTILEEQPPDLIRTESKGEEGSRASTVSSHNEVRLLDAEEGGIEIAYSADVAISGRLARYGQGMMKKIADKLAGRFEEQFRALAESEADAPVP
ncbi:MAG: carbon monoxide dehydrogenase subunit G [Alphaproteobacteria bacterium]|nr:carbon monoxide dehydrogenase subunit G [Alphaproteobacteria bacterium]